MDIETLWYALLWQYEEDNAKQAARLNVKLQHSTKLPVARLESHLLY